jgi:hypothetical protein
MITRQKDGSVLLQLDLGSIDRLPDFQEGLISVIQAACQDKDNFPNDFGNHLSDTLEILRATLLDPHQLMELNQPNIKKAS